MRREVFDMSNLRDKISALEKHEDEHHCCEPGENSHNQLDENLMELPLCVRKRLHALGQLQVERSRISAQFRQAILSLEREFHNKYEPLNKSRSEIVTGLREPTEEELINFDSSGVEEVNDVGTAKEPCKGIPLFWLTALGNHPDIGSLITESDSQALECLQDIRFSYLDGKPGFKLEFEFVPNEFFFNKVLSKEYHLAESENAHSDDFVYDYAVGTEIEWKTGKNLCFKTVVRTQRHRSNNSTRTIKREERTESFFHFFVPPAIPDHDEEADGDGDDTGDLESRLQFDYEVGEIIKDQIVPNAVDWFTGKALEYVELDEEDYSGEDYDEYEEEEDDDDDDEDLGDDGDEGASSRKFLKCRPSRHPRGTDATAGIEKSECKQQ